MIRFALASLSVAALIAAPAAAKGLVASQSVERMVVTELDNGQVDVAFMPADVVTPGEELVYSLKFQNDGADAASNVKLVMPVPSEVSYVENSATSDGVAVAFSADGGSTFSPRGELNVSVDGQARQALAEEITHIRWTFADTIAPGADGELLYRGILK